MLDTMGDRKWRIFLSGPCKGRREKPTGMNRKGEDEFVLLQRVLVHSSGNIFKGGDINPVFTDQFPESPAILIRGPGSLGDIPPVGHQQALDEFSLKLLHRLRLGLDRKSVV